MKKNFFLGIVVVAICMASCSGQSDKVNLKTAIDSASYALGVNIGASYRDASFPGEDLDVDLILKGFKSAFTNGEMFMTEEETYDFLNSYFEKASLAACESNKVEGETFLKENASKEGVVQTASGLQYRVVKEGNGEKPSATDIVTVHYTGKLLDGTVFDSSVTSGEPVSFPLDQVIPGWSEGVQLMNVGSKYEFWIPYDLAYGTNSVGGVIDPYSTLHFEVELLGIEKAK